MGKESSGVVGGLRLPLRRYKIFFQLTIIALLTGLPFLKSKEADRRGKWREG